MRESRLYLNDKEAYKAYIKELADNATNEQFTNSGKMRNTLVMSHIFRTSSEILRIYSDSLSVGVTNNEFFIENFYNFIVDGGNVYILLEKGFDKTSRLYSEIFQYIEYYDNITVHQNSGVLYSNDKHLPIHFSTGDDNKFIVEIDTKDHIAMCNFNDPTLTKYLNSVFDKSFKKLSGVKVVAHEYS